MAQITNVGKKIKALRNLNGWNQDDIASKLGISIAAFSKIETGITDMNLSRLDQIAEIFGTNASVLLSNDSEVADLKLKHQHEVDLLVRLNVELHEQLKAKTGK